MDDAKVADSEGMPSFGRTPLTLGCACRPRPPRDPAPFDRPRCLNPSTAARLRRQGFLRM